MKDFFNDDICIYKKDLSYRFYLDQPEYTAYQNYIKHLTLYQRLAFRPMLLSIGTYNYQLAIFLGKLSGDIISNNYSVKDTFRFTEQLKMVKLINACFLML